ncbi:hypothetical protein WJX81_003272 [Elliptochloris bilobata]|uniref:Uncharacterized protein n=1 Tax=Elliptochloris bilobata TaxID=381761 RepID=A0AAW1SLF9_9CHLO
MFPKTKPPTRTPVEKRASNKKDKRRRGEEKERRAEKRERKSAPEVKTDPNDPNSKLILNYSYVDTARRDTKF